MFSPQITDSVQQATHGFLKDLLYQAVFILIVAIECGAAHHRALGQRVRVLVEAGALHMVTGFKALALHQSDDGIAVTGEQDGAKVMLPPVDEVIVTTGFRPDLRLLSELRLALNVATESPTALAPLIDPNVHSCGTVPPHGVAELAHPERDFYIVGMKSYGRAPTFLLLTGYEQVRSKAAALTGDWEAARDVQLVLPETGVCSTSFGAASGGSCCGTDDAETGSAQAEAPLAGGVTIATDATSRRTGKPVSIPVIASVANSSEPSGGCCQ